jgi:hypothetical protein
MVRINYHRYVPLVVSTSWSFPHSWLITGFVARVTRRVELELTTLPEHMRTHPVFVGVCVARSLVFCVVFGRSIFVLFLLTIMLSVLRFTDYNYHFGIFIHKVYQLNKHQYNIIKVSWRFLIFWFDNFLINPYWNYRFVVLQRTLHFNIRSVVSVWVI